MCKTITFLAFFFFISGANAQVWIDSGAVWHYHSSSPWHMAYLKQEYTSDTIIDGHLCQKIIGESHSFIQDSAPNVYYESVSIRESQFTFSSADTVFYFAEDGFRILCDFGAQVGDSWVGMTFVNYMGNPDSLVVEVVETGTISLNNESFRYVDLVTDSCAGYAYGGRFVERFGFYQTKNEYGLSSFPYIIECGTIVETFGSGLYCYNDASFQLNGKSGEGCEYPGIEILSSPDAVVESFKIFPNPAKMQTQICGVNISGKELIVFDILGQLITKVTITSDNFNLSLHEFESGIYFLMIEESEVIKKLVVQ